MIDQPTLDGYAVDALVATGPAAEVWRGRELATGDTVTIKRLRAGGPQRGERLRREWTLLGSIAGPHLLGVRRITDTDPVVMVLDWAAGGSLASVLATRGRVGAGEVVTVLTPVATALAAAHERGLTHGDLTTAAVVFAVDGRPMLDGIGLRAAIAGTPPPPAADDVYALGVVGFTALAGRPPDGQPLAALAPGTPAALIVAVESMLAADPDARPPARLVARSVARAGEAVPVTFLPAHGMQTPPALPRPAATRPRGIGQALPPRAAGRGLPAREGVRTRARPTEASAPAVRARPRPAPAAGRRTRHAGPRRAARRIVLAAIALAAVVVVGEALRHHASPGAVTASAQPADVPADASPLPSASTATGLAGSSRSSETRWRPVVARLDALRARAFDAGRPALLARVYVLDSPAYTTDRARLTALMDRGLHAQGFTATVTHVRVQQSSATSARLRIADALSAYSLVDRAGAVVGTGAARPSRAFTMDLARVDGSWRVAAIRARR